MCAVCAEQRPTCVQTISADAPILFAKACELFILELTLRSWFHTDQNKRRTLQVDFRAAHPARPCCAHSSAMANASQPTLRSQC